MDPKLTNKERRYFLNAGLEITTSPLTQASLKTTWASTNPRLFVAFIKSTRPMDECCQN